MEYVVTCLTDEGPDQERVRVTRKTFTLEEAEHYVKGIAPSRKGEVTTLRIMRKQAEITDALGWVEDLRELNPTRADIFNATNYVTLLQDDLKKLKEQAA
jgi:hypothetical protein